MHPLRILHSYINAADGAHPCAFLLADTIMFIVGDKTPSEFLREEMAAIHELVRPTWESASAFLREYYTGGDAFARPGYSGAWDPQTGNQLKTPLLNRILHLLDLMASADGAATMGELPVESLVALALVRAHHEAVAYQHAFINSKERLGSEYSAVTKKREFSETLFGGPENAILMQIPCVKPNFYDTVPFFKLINENSKAVPLDRTFWVKMFVEQQEALIDSIVTNNKDSFMALAAASGLPHGEQEWTTFFAVRLPPLMVIQDGPHDLDDQLVVGMAMLLFRVGG